MFVSRGTAMVRHAAHNFPAPPRMLCLPFTFPTCPHPDAASQPRDLPSKKTDTHSLTPALVSSSAPASPASCSPRYWPTSHAHHAAQPTPSDSGELTHPLNMSSHTRPSSPTTHHLATLPRRATLPRSARTTPSPCPTTHHQPRQPSHHQAPTHPSASSTTPSPAQPSHHQETDVTQALTYQPPPAHQQHHAPRCRLATLRRPQPCTQPFPGSQAGVHASSTPPPSVTSHDQQRALALDI